MNIQEFDAHSWDRMDTEVNFSGYQSIYLQNNNVDNSNILIFKDEEGNLHVVIEVSGVIHNDNLNPDVNGLSIEIKNFKFHKTNKIKKFIDIKCALPAFKIEFTEVIKEIAVKILQDKEEPFKAITNTINCWKTFWGKPVKGILSEEEQIGLICELNVLKRLSNVDSEKALDYWKGPLYEGYDFILPVWCFEVKGTRRGRHTHTINGLDQLKPTTGKSLALISFLVARSSRDGAHSLQDEIDDVINTFSNNPLLIEKFYRILISAGYNRVQINEYRKLKYDIYDGMIYPVNEDFPKLISADLKQPLSSRISEIRYKIDLDGLKSQRVDELSMIQYF